MSFPVNFRFISGEISAEKMFLEKFYCTKRFVFEFQGESIELFLSYRASILVNFGSIARTVTVKND